MAATRALPKRWPKGKSLALSVSVMLEEWTADSAPGIGPGVNPMKPGVIDTRARSWAAYGPKVGAWRLLDVLHKARVKAVFYASGILGESQPALLREIVKQGHRLAAHSWAQNIVPIDLAPEEEERTLVRTVAVMEHASGARPHGWLSPRVTPSAHTAELLAALDFLWTADACDDDLPYRMTTTKGPLVAVPFSSEVNDLSFTVRYGHAPDYMPRAVGRILEIWPCLAQRPACLDVTAHAHIFGRPAGAIEFFNALEMIKRRKFAWLTNHGELAELYKSA